MEDNLVSLQLLVALFSVHSLADGIVNDLEDSFTRDIGFWLLLLRNLLGGLHRSWLLRFLVLL